MAFNPSTLIARVRRLHNVTSKQWSDEDALSDLNELKNNFLATLINSAEDGFNWEKWLAATVSLQGEYSLPSIGAATAGAKQIKAVAITYEGLTYPDTWAVKFVPATEVNPNTLPHHWSFYEANQQKEKPLYYVADDSLFIAPVPRASEAGASRLELRGIKSIPDYELSTAENAMTFQLDVQNLFVQGLAPYAMRSKGIDESAVISAITEFERLQKRKVSEMTSKTDSAWFMSYPKESSDTPITIE